MRLKKGAETVVDFGHLVKERGWGLYPKSKEGKKTKDLIRRQWHLQSWWW